MTSTRFKSIAATSLEMAEVSVVFFFGVGVGGEGDLGGEEGGEGNLTSLIVLDLFLVRGVTATIGSAKGSWTLIVTGNETGDGAKVISVGEVGDVGGEGEREGVRGGLTTVFERRGLGLYALGELPWLLLILFPFARTALLFGGERERLLLVFTLEV